jgi:lysophospholipase L1-like esterase
MSGPDSPSRGPHCQSRTERGAMMGAAKKNIMINICLALVSICISSAVGYYLHNWMKKPIEQVIYQQPNQEYDLSFYNQMGQKISEPNGTLKLMIDPFTVYRFYPNQKTRSYSINQYGFRDGYTSRKSYTAMLMGGSAAFGFALDGDEKTFSSKISSNNPKYNMINAAVVGFLSSQELSQMIHYLDDLEPKLYIVFNGWNDIYDPYTFAKAWPVSHGPIGYNNAFFMIEKRLAEYFQITVQERDLQVSNLEQFGTPLSEIDYFNKILQTYILNVKKMQAFAYARGASFLLIFQPELGNKRIKSAAEQETLNAWGSRFGYLDRKIPQRYEKLIHEAKKFFREQHIQFIDMNDEPEFSENPRTVFFDVVHPNDLGHEIIANIINRVLVDRF